MSSASSAVTYTSVYTNPEPGRVFWGANEELSDGGSLRVIGYGYDGLHMLPVAPPSPDYIPGPEEPQTPPAPQDEDEHEPMFIHPHDLDFVLEPIYPKYIPLEDEHILSAEEQPLLPVVSPMAESPGYVAESDPKQDPEEYEDDETEDSPVDYPIDGGDDDDDDDSSWDDANDVDEDEEDKEEEEHLAPADSAVVIPADELAAISFPPKAEVEILLAMPTPSPLTSLSPPYAGERLASCTAPAALPSPPLPPPLHMTPTVDRSRYEVEESSTARPTRGQGIDYGFFSTLDAEARRRGIGERVDLLMEDRIAHQETIKIVEDEAYAAREAWDHSIGLSQAVHSELQTHQEQVKFATCTLLDVALTWWNSQIRSLGPDAYSMTWEVLKKKMTDKYCPRGEIKKLEIELWNLKVKENNVSAYTERFQELTLICTKFVEDETEKIDKYKLRTYAERQSNNKRKADESFRNNHGHQHQTPKRQNVTRVYNMRTGERKPYSGNLPKYTKCHFYHNGPCTQKCHKCNKVGHFARDCKSSGNANVVNAQRNNGANPKGNGCFECGATWHFKRDCPKLKNKDGEKANAPGWVSFISTAFSSLIDIVPTPLGNSYDVELADGKIVGVDTIMRGCTLNFLGHPFNIDLMPVELGSSDVIIGMDWLKRCHAMIVCDEKLVQVPFGNETLTFRGDESNNGRESRLIVISCSKAQEYMAKGCQIFLAQISAKKDEDKSEGKHLEDVHDNLIISPSHSTSRHTKIKEENR
nr:hypothetical protein [Tanacetum cinerariifolium]